MFELSEVMSKPNAMFDWASKVVYNGEMTSDEKEITKGMDAWAREIGKKGDAGHEIAELVRKTFAPEEISAPSELISMIFDEDSIGEFDDYREEIDPKNTIVAHDAIIEGNVDRSFLEHKIGVPVWHNLAAETDVSMQDLRRGGYRSVANLTNYLREALELKRVQKIMAAIDAAIVSGQPNYIAEGEALPTTASMDALELYLHDVHENGDLVVFSLSKYHQAISKLPAAERFITDRERNMYNSTGFIDTYGGVTLMSYSSQKKLADGSLIVPDKRVFGFAGKIGSAITRGEARVLEEQDINTERIHIKVTGFNFGYTIRDAKKIAKMVMAK